VADWVVEQLIDQVVTWFAESVLGALDALWALLTATVFVSPDVTRLPQVASFADTSLDVVNTCYVLAFLWAGIVVLGRDTIQSQVGPGDVIPRLVIGLIAANFALPICSTAIQLANALTAALTGQDITAPGSMQHLRALTVAALTDQTGASPVGFLLALIGLMIAVLVGVLLVQWIVRVGLLIVTAGVAPIAVALHGTAQTEAAAKLWWRTLIGALGTVTLQAIALHLTLTIFLDPAANFPVLGLPRDSGALLNLLVVVCLLWGVTRIPALMSRFVLQSKPGGLTTMLRVILIQQVTRRLRPVPIPARAVAGTDRPWPVTSRKGP
jgi:hypothetical protein